MKESNNKDWISIDQGIPAEGHAVLVIRKWSFIPVVCVYRKFYFRPIKRSRFDFWRKPIMLNEVVEWKYYKTIDPPKMMLPPRPIPFRKNGPMKTKPQATPPRDDSESRALILLNDS